MRIIVCHAVPCHRRAFRCAACSLAILFVGLGSLSMASEIAAQDPFAANIRPTDPLTPAEERLALKVPDGFEVQLVAAEPDIQKPMNMAFDARGRLWITDTREYPLPVEEGTPGRDTIKILEDHDGDGKAEKITTFADGLNIPIGLYPFKNGCVVFSIPHIWWLEDTDGDDVADRRTQLYGPFGVDRDTHGLYNSFRRSYVGWLYACHGFNNHTTVAGRDGHQITMQSGNTYRFRLDGNRIEHFTWGQVNPFGMAVDRWGNRFTADCHSKPIYELLRGGYYPSFGKPHDGLGFVSPMMDHLHGSTAIAGLACYEDERFPAEYRDNFFSGNVMTSRVNRDSVQHQGSTPLAVEEADFVISEDPWFRPVDVQLGPDGAIYVADFYNRIIGHYEVDLHHPGRDRTSGRLWRIVYRDTDGQVTSPPLSSCDLTSLDWKQRIDALGNTNLTRRLLALNLIVDDVTAATRDTVVTLLLNTLQHPRNAEQNVAALWALWRLQVPIEAQLVSSLADDSALVRVHAARILIEMPDWNESIREAMRLRLNDDHPLVQRTVAEGFSVHPSRTTLPLVVERLHERLQADPSMDPHRTYMFKRALKSHLLLDGAYATLAANPFDADPAALRAVDEISLAVPTADSARYLLNRMSQNQLSANVDAVSASEHIARYCDASDVAELAKIAQQRFQSDRLLQVSLIRSIRTALTAKQASPPEALNRWGIELALSIWKDAAGENKGWANFPLVGKLQQDNPWEVAVRASADGVQDALFFDSLPSGEVATGVLRSQVFEIPQQLSFYCAGHLGPPNEPLVPQNFVRLVDAETGRVLQEARPPRNDLAQRIEWDLDEFAGKSGRLEIIDGDQRNAYAWIAVGRFDPPVVEVPQRSPRATVQFLSDSLDLIQWESLSIQQGNTLRTTLEAYLHSAAVDPTLRAAIGRHLVVARAQPELLALCALLDEPSTSEAQRQQIADAILVLFRQSFSSAFEELFPGLSSPAQRLFLRELAKSAKGRVELTRMLDSDQVAPTLWHDAALQESIRAAGESTLVDRLEAYLAKHPVDANARQQTVDARIRFIGEHPGDAAAGAELFRQHCAKCHKLGDQGEEIGPQLDGIGQRGLVRIVEDVVDPNRNVDPAFRSTTILTVDGKVVVGLFRRKDGAASVFVDREGKEFRLSQDDIEQQQVTLASLMPDDVAMELPPNKFADLITYLMEQRQKSDDSPPAARQRP